MKRVLMMMVTNFAVIAVLSVTWNILDSMFGVSQMIEQSFGIPGRFGYVALFSLVLGFGGAFVSLYMSKGMAKRSMGVNVIEQPRTEEERWLVEIVHRQARQAGIGMPEVGTFESPQPNAFATGASRNNALVAVSTGLLHHMSRDEVEAVLGHEVSHVANGDMITQTLLQGILNTFVMFFARVIGFIVDRALSSNRNGEGRGGYGFGYYIASMIAEMALGFLATAVVMWYSRRREYFADEGGADLAGKQKMIAALKALQHSTPHDLPGEMAAFGISGGMGKGLKKLFITHPPLEDRIAALERYRG